MITTTITVDQKDVQRVINLLVKQLPDAIMNEMDVAVKNSLDQIKETINTDYKRVGEATPSSLNPSPSGKGFTDRTGALRGSITTWVEQSLTGMKGTISTGTSYDKYVELLWGGKYSFMLPAALQNQSFIFKEIESAVGRAISRVSI